MEIRTHSAHLNPLTAYRPGCDLFLLSALIPFLAQVCLRWFPERVFQLNRFPDVVLLACLLGTAVGCLAAGRALRLLTGTPLSLAVATAVAAGGFADYVHRYQLPLREVLQGGYFILIALTLAGPGQELGRALDRVPNRLLGLALLLLGGGTGLLLFAACTYTELGPWWWFLPVVLGLAYFDGWRAPAGSPWAFWLRPVSLMLLAGSLGLVGLASFGLPLSGAPAAVTFWSPYARITYDPGAGSLTANRVGRQVLLSAQSRREPANAYALPYLLNRDAGGPPFRRVLVIGAGIGNEVSRALCWGAEHVDAVEIDPVILRLGYRDHPDHPYQDPRVHVYLGDGRRFLRAGDREYDLILCAFTDTPIPPFDLNDFRREGNLLTRQAFADVRRRLSPQGIFVLGVRVQWGWVAARLRQGLEEVVPEPPLLLPIPHQTAVAPGRTEGLVLFFAGNTAALRRAFRENPIYRLRGSQLPAADTPNGFTLPAEPSAPGEAFGPATVDATEYLDTAEDDWPFLFLRRRLLPERTVRDMLLLAVLALLLLWLFRPAPDRTGAAGGWLPFRPEMFLLGAGLLLTTTGVRVDAALLAGDTWVVRVGAGLATLALLLAAVGLARVLRPARLWPAYTGLLTALALHSLFPLDGFLGQGGSLPLAGSCLAGLAPVLFAGMIAAVLFRESPEPARDLGAVLAGAVLGGLAENTALVWGFYALLLPAVGCYVASAVPSARRALREYERRHPRPAAPARNGSVPRRAPHP